MSQPPGDLAHDAQAAARHVADKIRECADVDKWVTLGLLETSAWINQAGRSWYSYRGNLREPTRATRTQVCEELAAAAIRALAVIELTGCDSAEALRVVAFKTRLGSTQ